MPRWRHRETASFGGSQGRRHARDVDLPDLVVRPAHSVVHQRRRVTRVQLHKNKKGTPKKRLFYLADKNGIHGGHGGGGCKD